jgi:hypothetical protein
MQDRLIHAYLGVDYDVLQPVQTGTTIPNPTFGPRP